MCLARVLKYRCWGIRALQCFDNRLRLITVPAYTKNCVSFHLEVAESNLLLG